MRSEMPSIFERFLYIENHWLGQWFKKAYGDEEKTLLESRSSPPTEPRN
jgi:hypothetical protein